MSTDQQRLYKLLTHPEWSPIDEEWMADYIRRNDYAAWQDALQELFKEDQDKKIDPVVSERMRQQVLQRIQREEISVPGKRVHRVHFLKTSWFRYAAAVVLVAGAAIAYVISSDSEKSPSLAGSSKQLKQNITPGTNRAILTVDNQAIDLSNNKTGINVGNAITYNDGELIAEAGRLLQLATPRGGQYQAVLPDGSKVWLNAASSIRFPSKFSGDKREVEIEGEVYMEIAQNAKQPFFVHTDKTTVQVLGTSFNVNTYSDEESEKTTLIEGSVRVIVNATSGNERSEILRPGQEASIFNSQLTTRTVDREAAIAWKNGIFNFEGSDLRSVMRQLERWYDIKVEYQGAVPGTTFSGKIYKSVSFSDVLEMLQKMGVKARMEGKTLIVL